MSSPLEEHPRTGDKNKIAKPNVFNSPGPARQLFNSPSTKASPRPAANRRLTNATPAPVRRASIRSASRLSRGGTPSSSRSTPVPGSALRPSVKLDLANEVIRGDLNSVRYELQTQRE